MKPEIRRLLIRGSLVQVQEGEQDNESLEKSGLFLVMRYLSIFILSPVAFFHTAYSQKKANLYYATAYQAGNLVGIDTVNGYLEVGQLTHVVPYAQLFKDSVKANHSLQIQEFEQKYGLEPNHLDRIYKADTVYHYYIFKGDSFVATDKKYLSASHFYTPVNDDNEYNNDSITNPVFRKSLGIPDSMKYVADGDTVYSTVQIFYSRFFDMNMDGKPELAVFYGFGYSSEVSTCQTGGATVVIYQEINKKWKLYQRADCSFINGCEPAFNLVYLSKNNPPVIILTEQGFDYNDNDFVNRTLLVPKPGKNKVINVISLLK